MNKVLLSLTALCLVMSVFCHPNNKHHGSSHKENKRSNYAEELYSANQRLDRGFPSSYESHDYAKFYGNNLFDSPFDKLTNYEDEQNQPINGYVPARQHQISNAEFTYKMPYLMTIISHVCCGAQNKLVSFLATVLTDIQNGKQLSEILQRLSTLDPNEYSNADILKVYLNDELGSEISVSRDLADILKETTFTDLTPATSDGSCESVSTMDFTIFLIDYLTGKGSYGSKVVNYDLLSTLTNPLTNLLSSLPLLGNLLGPLLGPASNSPSERSRALINTALYDRSATGKKQQSHNHPKKGHHGHDKKKEHKNRAKTHQHHERSSSNKHGHHERNSNKKHNQRSHHQNQHQRHHNQHHNSEKRNSHHN